MDRDMVMSNFLAATGIEDIGNALSILEQHSWDLLASVSSVIPQDFQPSSFCEDTQGSQEERVGGLARPSSQQIQNDLSSPLLRQPQAGVPYLNADFISQPLSVSRAQRTVAPDMPILPMPTMQPRGSSDHHPLSHAVRGVTDDEKVVPLRNPYSTISSESTNAVVVIDDDDSRDQFCQKDRVPSKRDRTSERVANGFKDSDSEGSEYYSPAEEFESHDVEEEVGGGDSPLSIPSSVKHGELIPEACTDASIALQLFTDNFEQRYGYLHPLFYVGPLSEALKEASSPLLPTSRKPLMVYLHHDRSILSNIFCSQLLCAESVVNLLSANFISWAWDLTSDQQKRILLDMVKESFGEQTATSVESVKSDHLPVILLVCKVAGRLEVQNIVQGHTDLETFIGHLLTCMEAHGEQVQRDNIEEQARIERDRMIEEQDRRFRESLEADRLKEEKKMKAERLVVEEQQLKEAERRRCSNAVPFEPEEDYQGKVGKIRFRCPSGETLMRSFRAEETLEMLLNYLGSESFPVGQYKVLTSYPRRDISELDPTKTLDVLGLCPQATLFIEEK